MESHVFRRSELDCMGLPSNLPIHKFCVNCGYCEFNGCSEYKHHAYHNDPEPKPRGGHPRFYDLVKEITDLHDKKNTDYAGGTKEGALGNFVRVSTIMGLYPGLNWDSPFGVTICYLLKQLDAALTLRSQKRESVVGEGIATRLRDVTVYSLIGQIQVEEESDG